MYVKYFCQVSIGLNKRWRGEAAAILKYIPLQYKSNFKRFLWADNGLGYTGQPKKVLLFDQT